MHPDFVETLSAGTRRLLLLASGYLEGGSMGFAIDLHCKACGYVADRMVLGLDCGEMSVVHSVTCADCRELRVVLLPEWPPLLRDARGDLREQRADFSKLPPLRCPESDAHRVEPWYHPGPCPRCGAPNLRMGKRGVIWD